MTDWAAPEFAEDRERLAQRAQDDTTTSVLAFVLDGLGVLSLAELNALVVAGRNIEAIRQHVDWAAECLESGHFVAGRSTYAGDRALAYIERVQARLLAL